MGVGRSAMETLEVNSVKEDFWAGKRVFLTGHTGFKGGWLAVWLQMMGSTVKGYALEPNTYPSFFEAVGVAHHMESEIGDIRDLKKLRKSMVGFNPDVLIHMAAQPLVRLSYKEPIETYSTNVMGTVNVLESARHCINLKAVVSVTTDKCYENKEWYWGYRENEPMGGYDPYSSSKACAELVTSAYRNSFFGEEGTAAIASARAGNVIGGGDWSEDRLIPDIVRALEKSENVLIRSPKAIRPWQHVLEPLSGYLILAQKLYEHGSKFAEAWNFGPEENDVKDVAWITERMCTLWGGDSSFVLDKSANPHEANYLKLDCSKAKSRLKWRPKWTIDQALQLTIEWTLAVRNGQSAREITQKQLKHYVLSQ